MIAPPARLYVLIARRAARAVIFRRGPAKRTLVLCWNLLDDTLQSGQWFNGRIYERRCDLSPDGDLLVCNVGGHPPLTSWTAISRPPFLTARALWPDSGAGGLFGDDWTTLELNDRSLAKPVLRPTDQELPSGFKIALIKPTLKEHALVRRRLERDGWVTMAEGRSVRLPRGSKLQTRVDPPGIRQKSIGPGGLTLQVALHGTYEANGPIYVETSQILDQSERVVVDLGRIDWVDVDHSGDVLYAADGCIHRLRHDQIGQTPHDAGLSMVADLNAMEFTRLIAPDWARRWP